MDKMKAEINKLLLASADTGSMPCQDDFDGNRAVVDRTIIDKVSVGLDYPCYPQLIGSSSDPMNMGLQYLAPLSRIAPQIQITGEKVHLLSSEIQTTSEPIGVERAEYYIEFLRAHHLIEKLRGTKACVTGPFTLASYLDSEKLMTCGASKPNVVKSLASILSNVCKRLSQLGFDLITIDEPFLALMLGSSNRILFQYDTQFVLDMLDTLVKEISCISAIHVCGVITPMVRKTLLTCEADVLDHEFAANPKNLVAYSKDDLESNEKFLAFGCVSSSNPRVETVEEIAASLQKALRTYGHRIMAKPDCGFGGMHGSADGYAIALEKLRNITEASRKVAATL
jgi:methionine synthase II (cobalamin-independent)